MEEKMVVYWTFLANYNLQFDLLREGEEKEVIHGCYSPLIETIRDFGVKSCHAFTGWTLEETEKVIPNSLDDLKSLLEKNDAELVAHTYGHPILTMLPNWEAEAQIRKGVEIEKKVFGKRSRGFYPPEWCFDHTLPHIAKENNLEWMVLVEDNVVGAYGMQPKDILKPKKVEGIFGSSIPCVFIYGGKELGLRNKMYGALEGRLDPKEFTDGFAEAGKLEEDNPLMIFYMDSESPFFATTSSNPKPFEKVKRFFGNLMSNKDLSNTTVSEYLLNNTPVESATPKISEGYKPPTTWTTRFEKLDMMLNDCRMVLIDRLQEGDFDQERINEAWKYLMLAEGSDVRSTIQPLKLSGIPISGRKVYGNPRRLMEGYEYAIKCSELLK